MTNRIQTSPITPRSGGSLRSATAAGRRWLDYVTRRNDTEKLKPLCALSQHESCAGASMEVRIEYSSIHEEFSGILLSHHLRALSSAVA
jgi:hypothetical protein